MARRTRTTTDLDRIRRGSDRLSHLLESAGMQPSPFLAALLGVAAALDRGHVTGDRLLGYMAFGCVYAALTPEAQSFVRAALGAT